MHSKLKNFLGRAWGRLNLEERVQENISKEEFRKLIANPPSHIKSINFESSETGVTALHIEYEAGDDAFVKVDSITPVSL